MAANADSKAPTTAATCEAACSAWLVDAKELVALSISFIPIDVRSLWGKGSRVEYLIGGNLGASGCQQVSAFLPDPLLRLHGNRHRQQGSYVTCRQPTRCWTRRPRSRGNGPVARSAEPRRCIRVTLAPRYVRRG